MNDISLRLPEIKIPMPPAQHMAERLLRNLWNARHPLFFVALPTLAAIVYYGLVATPIYVSDSSFIVRMAAPPATSSFGSFLETAGIARAQDDTFSVQEFLASRDALHQLVQALPIHSMFTHPDIDALARFPQFWESDTFEGLFRYFGSRVEVAYNSTTGITSLRTTAFTPQDSYDLNQALLGFGGDFLTRMNDRARADAVRFAEQEVRASEQRLLDAQTAITEFRNRELVIDPDRASTTMLDLIANLAAEQADMRARRAELLASAPDSSALPFVSSRIEALEGQIEAERAKVVGTDASMAPRIAAYERLTIAREFADKALVSASSALDSARADARRQQLYLERIVEPGLPDEADQPQRLKAIAVIFLVTGGLYLIGRLLITAIRDYAHS